MGKEIEQLEEAKKRYLEALKTYKERLEHGEISLDEALDAEEKAEDELGVWEAYDKLKEARKRLLEIAKPILLRRARKQEEVEAIEKTFSCKLVSIQEELIDTILQWDPRLDETLKEVGGTI
jgi:oligoendopeptidase F